MKRLFFTLIVAVAAFISTSAQTAVGRLSDPSRRLIQSDVWSLDTLQLDSLYDRWNNYVLAHPKNEQAWRNLFEIYRERSVRFWGNIEGAREYKRQKSVMERMEQAIPDTYTFNYCAYEIFYPKNVGEPYDEAAYARVHNQYAERAFELLPDDAQAHDYETWASYLITQKTGQDTTQLTDLLTRYFESGYYPAEALQYHFNELQGMDEGAIYIGHVEGDIYGKLILQLVQGVHRDKILYCENVAHFRPYIEAVFQQAGLSMDFFEPDSAWARAEEQEEEYRLIIQYICEHSTRPVYTSASSINNLILDKGLPDDLKACFYNEGLTMHYSAKPYDNQAVKRRNVEERYRLEYLRLSFMPNDYSKDSRRFKQPNDMLAFNYLLLLNDLMPYYKAHSPQRHAWLNSLFTDVFDQIMRNNVSGYGFGGNMFHINVVTEGGLHYEVVQEPYLIENPEDDEATRQRKRDEQKAKTRVIIKTEPVK